MIHRLNTIVWVNNLVSLLLRQNLLSLILLMLLGDIKEVLKLSLGVEKMN